MVSSITSALGAGSGIDTDALIEKLSSASRTPKEALIKAREDLNSARISALGKASSGIDAFTSALTSLISGGTLFTQPTSSDTSIAATSAVAGGRLGGLAASLEVRQLAQAQTLVSENLTSSSAVVGQGTLTLTTANGSFDVVIGSSNDSLAGLVAAINAAGAGVAASVVQDSAGARLVIKSATGAAQAFTLAVQSGADPALARFAYDPLVSGGMTRALEAKDAIVRLDGVEVTRASNSFTDLIPGVKIDLKKAAIGTTVEIGSSRPTAALKQAMSDFVAAYNELKAVLDNARATPSATNPDAGGLRDDAGIREMQRRLGQLVTTPLSSAGGISTLAEVGIRTNRDGTLSVDNVRLDTVLASDPGAVEALFNPAQSSSSPLLRIVNPAGRAKPGIYTVTDVTTSPVAGNIGGIAAQVVDNKLIATAASGAAGLIIEPLGNVASATITVDLGLGGALQAIRDALRAGNGPLAASKTRIEADTKTISADRVRLDTRETAYRDRLVKSFSGMESRVSALKATQSYLDQQIKMWTSGNN